MTIPLNSFEQHIDPTILQRGFSYFKNGYVEEPIEISNGQYDAIVVGSEEYMVNLTIKNQQITEYNCDCPFDSGPICKHVVAVIFYLQQDELDLQAKSKTKKAVKTKKEDQKPKKKSVSQQVSDVLEKVSHEELKQFIRNNTEQNAPFRNLFLSSFAHQNSSDSQELYQKQVKAIIRSVSRSNYLDYSDCRKVAKDVDVLLVAAQKQIDTANYQSAIFICCAVLEEMNVLVQYSDDSGGYLGDSISEAIGLLKEMSVSALPEANRISLFQYCIAIFEKGTFRGWDWHLGMMEIASALLKTAEEAEKVMTLLDGVTKSEYSRDQAQLLKYQIIRKTQGEAAADTFIEQNLGNSDLRHEAISRAIENDEFEKAISLCHDGIRMDEKSKPGLALDWYDWLLRIAMKQNDTPKIVEYARYLFIDNFRSSQGYYGILKSHIPTGEWTAFVEKMIADISQSKRWTNVQLLGSIYIYEEWWPRLFEHLKQDPSLNNIEYYEKYLAKDYAMELAVLYNKAIITYLEYNVSRSHYKTACRYLIRMKKLGATLLVNNAVDQFRKQYPQRKALMEELNKV